MKPLAVTVALASAGIMFFGRGERVAHADPPAPALMEKLAIQAHAFEDMKKRASYAVSGRMDRMDGDNKIDQVKEMSGRVVADGTNTHFEVVKYLEDGADKTEEAKTKAKDSAKQKKKKTNFRMPFHEGEQSRYVFDTVETDARDPARVRVTFVPKVRAEDTIEGSAWINTATGTIVSAGFKLSQLPTMVDYVHITVEFGEKTALGPAVSHITMDGRGGFLFFHKTFKVDAKVSDYTLAP